MGQEKCPFRRGTEETIFGEVALFSSSNPNQVSVPNSFFSNLPFAILIVAYVNEVLSNAAEGSSNPSLGVPQEAST